MTCAMRMRGDPLFVTVFVDVVGDRWVYAEHPQIGSQILGPFKSRRRVQSAVGRFVARPWEGERLRISNIDSHESTYVINTPTRATVTL